MSYIDCVVESMIRNDSAVLLAADLVDSGRITETEAEWLIATLEPVIQDYCLPIAERLTDLEIRVIHLEARMNHLEGDPT